LASKNFDEIIINDIPYRQLRTACNKLDLRENTISYRIHRETTAIPPSNKFTVKSRGELFKIELIKEVSNEKES